MNKLRNRNVLIDNTEDLMKKELQGIMKTKPGYYELIDDDFGYGLKLCDSVNSNKVGIIASGGGGLGRLFPAVVHEKLADAVSIGNMDTAPNYLTIYNLAKQVDTGKGILLLTNNYSGDVMHNEMAQEMLEAEGISTKLCKVTDNFFSAKDKQKRSGLCGILTLIKVSKALANKGMELNEIDDKIQRLNNQMDSVTVMLNEKGQLMYGKGLADEPSQFTSEFLGEDRLIKELCDVIINDSLLKKSEKKVSVQLNTMQYTSYIEGNVLLNGIVDYLASQGFEVVLANVGCYYDMFNYPGLILTVMSVDNDIEEYIRPVTNYDYTI